MRAKARSTESRPGSGQRPSASTMRPLLPQALRQATRLLPVSDARKVILKVDHVEEEGHDTAESQTNGLHRVVVILDGTAHAEHRHDRKHDRNDVGEKEYQACNTGHRRPLGSAATQGQHHGNTECQDHCDQGRDVLLGRGAVGVDLLHKPEFDEQPDESEKRHDGREQQDECPVQAGWHGSSGCGLRGVTAAVRRSAITRCGRSSVLRSWRCVLLRRVLLLRRSVRLLLWGRVLLLRRSVRLLLWGRVGLLRRGVLRLRLLLLLWRRVWLRRGGRRRRCTLQDLRNGCPGRHALAPCEVVGINSTLRLHGLKLLHGIRSVLLAAAANVVLHSCLLVCNVRKSELYLTSLCGHQPTHTQVDGEDAIDRKS